jgi:hypothetical protein
MTITGYTIQSVTEPAWLTSSIWIHLVAGGLFTVGIALHFRESLRR